jgi:Ca2+-binding RTX toxin-like protein
VNNVDTIEVDSSGTAADLRIDLGGGAFAPGETSEVSGDSEIEWLVDLMAGSTLRVLGSSQIDRIVLGSGGINLNAAESPGDADVIVTGAPTTILDGNDGADVLSVAGGAGTGAPGSVATVLGGAGADMLVPGAIGSTFQGDDGVDTLDYSDVTGPIVADLPDGTITAGGDTDTVSTVEDIVGTDTGDRLIGDAAANELDGGPGNDRISGGGGDDTLIGGSGIDRIDMSDASHAKVDLAANSASGAGADDLSGFEDIVGSPGKDRLMGNANANDIAGAGGPDTINGRAGTDTLHGGKGKDTVSLVGARHGATVDLRDGTAIGLGPDSLSGFENVKGSGKADVIDGDGHRNLLDGAGGADEISGHSGPDRVIGAQGADLLFGHKGDDRLLGGSGDDQLDGGKGLDDVCRGGAGADAYVWCENFRTSLPGVWLYESPAGVLPTSRLRSNG